MRLSRRAYAVVAWLFVAGVVIQVFLAGLGVFDDPATFQVHAGWGYMLELLPIILLVLALVGRLGRRLVLYAVALFGMFILQSLFVGLRADVPAIAALHPVNGFAILLVGILMARDAWVSRDAPEAAGQAMPGVAPSTPR